MSLLTGEPTFTPPSKEQRLKNIAQNIKGATKQAYKQITDIQRNGVNLVWGNPNLTPQEIIDALGDDAVKIFQYHGLLTDLIKQLAALDGVTPDIKLPTNEFTITDGKITVGTGPYTVG